MYFYGTHYVASISKVTETWFFDSVPLLPPNNFIPKPSNSFKCWMISHPTQSMKDSNCGSPSL